MVSWSSLEIYLSSLALHRGKREPRISRHHSWLMRWLPERSLPPRKGHPAWAQLEGIVIKQP